MDWNFVDFIEASGFRLGNPWLSREIRRLPVKSVDFHRVAYIRLRPVIKYSLSSNERLINQKKKNISVQNNGHSRQVSKETKMIVV